LLALGPGIGDKKRSASRLLGLPRSRRSRSAFRHAEIQSLGLARPARSKTVISCPVVAPAANFQVIDDRRSCLRRNALRPTSTTPLNTLAGQSGLASVKNGPGRSSREMTDYPLQPGGRTKRQPTKVYKYSGNRRTTASKTPTSFDILVDLGPKRKPPRSRGLPTRRKQPPALLRAWPHNRRQPGAPRGALILPGSHARSALNPHKPPKPARAAGMGIATACLPRSGRQQTGRFFGL